VIDVGTAGGPEDTGGVVVEGSAGGINGDCNGLLGNGSLELAHIVVGNGGDALDEDLTLGAAVLAGTILTLVGVVRLQLDGAVLGVLESDALVTTIATPVLGGAVNELLLG